jgi:xyloglucan fucosyltransferase
MEEMYRRVDTRGSHGNGTSPAMVSPIYASQTTERWDFQPQPRFFCDTEQAQYTQVDWIGFRNNLYYIPKLFAVPTFRPLLESIFPDLNVLTHVLRTLMLPSDAVWGRVKQVHDAHFRHANRRVGVQLRYFRGPADFFETHENNEEHVKQCLVQNRFLPNPNGSPSVSPPSVAISPLQPMNVTTVLVTSLYQGLFDRLTKDYVRTSLESGDAVGILQLTHEGDQYFGVEVDRQALVEILSLSLTDDLILTPLSTFGAIAQGYGSLTPWYIDLRRETDTPCVRALSLEPCYQIPASTRFLCPHDVKVNGNFMVDEVGYISDCHPVEDPFFKVNSAGLGIQLLVEARR